MSGEIKEVLIAGYGVMGRGIALAFARGDLGVSTGEGFYDWKGRDVTALKARWADKVKRVLAIAQEE